MSRHIDAILERLARYEERLDVTGKQLKRQLAEMVDLRIGALKRNVKHVRTGILRGRFSASDRQHTSELLAQGLAVEDRKSVV